MREWAGACAVRRGATGQPKRRRRAGIALAPLASATSDPTVRAPEGSPQKSASPASRQSHIAPRSHSIQHGSINRRLRQDRGGVLKRIRALFAHRTMVGLRSGVDAPSSAALGWQPANHSRSDPLHAHHVGSQTSPNGAQLCEQIFKLDIYGLELTKGSRHASEFGAGPISRGRLRPAVLSIK